MERIKPRTLSGFMELLPAPQTQFERMLEILRHTYSLYGFTPLDTPVIESAEILLAKGGGETEKQIYRFTKGDSDLALRSDLTVPLAKYVALPYADLAFPFRRSPIGQVSRGERAQRGRFREFYTCATAATAEYLGARSGLGIWLQAAYNSFQTPRIFAATLVIIVITGILLLLVHAVERLLLGAPDSDADPDADAQ